MATYTREQLDNIRRIKNTPEYKAASPKERKALFEATAVESNHRDLNYGDRDSLGILQQRNNGAWGAAKESVEKDVGQFLAVARQKNATGKYGSAGSLAQAVQVSAFPDRYDEHSDEADALTRGGRPAVPAASRGVVRKGTAPTLNKGGTTTDTKGAVTAALLDPRKKMSLISRIRGELESGNYTKTALPTVTPGTAPKYGVPAATRTQKQVAQSGGTIADRANALDKKKLPYKWGGSHSPADKSGLYDCSSAVSKILGISPRVSGQFMKWGKAGRDPKGKFTVYANAGHVLVEINGKFWGTSGDNPGGGPGWIERAKVSPGYLSKFTARHQ